MKMWQKLFWKQLFSFYVFLQSKKLKFNQKYSSWKSLKFGKPRGLCAHFLLLFSLIIVTSLSFCFFPLNTKTSECISSVPPNRAPHGHRGARQKGRGKHSVCGEKTEVKCQREGWHYEQLCNILHGENEPGSLQLSEELQIVFDISRRTKGEVVVPRI